MTRSHLWDFAGSWPVLRSAGLELRSWKTGAVLDRIDTRVFSGSSLPWKLRDFYIVSSERNFSILKNKIREKRNDV